MTIEHELMLTLIHITHRNVVHEPPFQSIPHNVPTNARGSVAPTRTTNSFVTTTTATKPFSFFSCFICLVVIYSGVVEQQQPSQLLKSKCVWIVAV
jgi:hypothetical protein